MIGFKNEREEIGCLFYWTWRDVNLLPTYPFKGSKFHVVLFQNIFVSLVQFLVLKMVLKKEIRGRKGLRLGNE